MDIFYNVVLLLSSILLGYIICNIPVSLIIGKVFFNVDIREHGSHNLGGTNAGRVLGKKIGFIVIVLDMIKTICPMFIVWAIVTYSGLNNPDIVGFELWNGQEAGGALFYYLCLVGSVLGHCYPIFLNFKGGKGVASLFGTGLTIAWANWFFLPLFFIIIKFKKYVSLASIIITVIVTCFAWVLGGIQMYNSITDTVVFDPNLCLWGWGGLFTLGFGYEYPLAITIASAVVIFRHKDNIKRILDGTEKKAKWAK